MNKARQEKLSIFIL